MTMPQYDLCGKEVTREHFIKVRLKEFRGLHSDSINVRGFKPETKKEKELWEIAWRTEKTLEDAIDLVTELESEIKILETTK